MISQELGETVLEIDDGGRTIWLNAAGGNVLRIKCTGKVKVHKRCSNNITHADIHVHGDIEVCIPEVCAPEA